MNFIHMADMHLGYRQYDLEQRFLDFGHTFKKIAEYAVTNKVDFVLIAGDLFDKRSINASTFVQASHVLSMLEKAGIPCIVIEGNHDRSIYKDKMSWLESLDEQGIKLLKVIKNYDGNLMGDYIDIGKTRIFGYGFGGSMTSNAIPLISNEIKGINGRDPPEYTILMMHIGVEGKVKGGIVGEVTYDDLCQLKGLVDYLALGHYHSAYEIDGWVYNPGCPDTCSIAEVSVPKGFYHVIDGVPKFIRLEPRRFFVLKIRVDEYKDAKPLVEAIDEGAAGLEQCDGPVISIILEGTLNFDKSHIDVEAIREMVKERTNALYVDLRFDLANDEFFINTLDMEGLDRTAIELEVFRKMALSDSMIADKCDIFAASMVDIKSLASKGADDKTLDAVMRKAFEALDSCQTPGAIAQIKNEPVVPVLKTRTSVRGKKRPPKEGQTSLSTGGEP